MASGDHEIPSAFIELIHELVRRQDAAVSSFIYSEVGVRASKSAKMVTWSRLLNIKYKFASKILPFRVAKSTYYYMLNKIKNKLKGMKWNELKSQVWIEWAKIVRERVTDLPELIKAILGYAMTARAGAIEERYGEKISQASIEIYNAFLKERKVSAIRGEKLLRTKIAGIPLHLLMMMPSPVTAKIYYRRCGRDQENAVIKNAALRRSQKKGSLRSIS